MPRPVGSDGHVVWRDAQAAHVGCGGRESAVGRTS